MALTLYALLFYFFLMELGIELTQCLTFERKGLYHLSHASQPFSFIWLFKWDLMLFALQEAGRTDICHHPLLLT
jgi:hypothetical protein